MSICTDCKALVVKLLILLINVAKEQVLAYNATVDA